MSTWGSKSLSVLYISFDKVISFEDSLFSLKYEFFLSVFGGEFHLSFHPNRKRRRGSYYRSNQFLALPYIGTFDWCFNGKPDLEYRESGDWGRYSDEDYKQWKKMHSHAK